MMYLIYLKVASICAEIVANGDALTTTIIAILGFIFFLGCMGKAVGMNVTLNFTIFFTAIVAGIRMLFRAIRWLFRNFVKIVKGTFNGTEKTLTKFGVTPGKARFAAILASVLMIIVII